MNQRKPNSSAWYSLGLGVLLCIAALVVSTGTAFARYRTERTKTVDFAVREPERIVLGTTLHTVTAEEATKALPKDTVVLPEQKELKLENVDGTYRLTMVVGNGPSEVEYSERDQCVQLRLVATLGMWANMQPMEMNLIISKGENPEEEESVLAVPVQIEKDTALYYTYGDGWVYTFQGEDGELTWELPGGEFFSIELTVAMTGATPQEEAILYPQITAWVTE